jgi:hypothetical protein
LIRLAAPELEFLGIPIKDLPLYSHDYDEDSPEGTALKEALSSVDGLRPGILGADLRHAAAHRGVRHDDRGSMPLARTKPDGATRSATYQAALASNVPDRQAEVVDAPDHAGSPTPVIRVRRCDR